MANSCNNSFFIKDFGYLSEGCGLKSQSLNPIVGTMLSPELSPGNLTQALSFGRALFYHLTPSSWIVELLGFPVTIVSLIKVLNGGGFVVKLKDDKQKVASLMSGKAWLTCHHHCALVPAS